MIMPITTIVTGCERSGTTHFAKKKSEELGLPYYHEKYGEGDVVMKHALNSYQNLKHLEFLRFLFPKSDWYFVIRDGREVCRSLVQKIWQRYPHTMSLDDAIRQWNRVNKSCYEFVNSMDGVKEGHIIRYEELETAMEPKWPEYFTDAQVSYMENKLRLEEFGYEKRF